MKNSTKQALQLAMEYGYAFGKWNGENNSTFETSNAKIQKLAFKGIDTMLTIPTIKQLSKYAKNAFQALLVEGFEVVYQTQKLSVKQVSYNSYKVVVKNMTTNNMEAYTLSLKQLLNASLEGINKDISDILAQLYILVA